MLMVIMVNVYADNRECLYLQFVVYTILMVGRVRLVVNVYVDNGERLCWRW